MDALPVWAIENRDHHQAGNAMPSDGGIHSIERYGRQLARISLIAFTEHTGMRILRRAHRVGERITSNRPSGVRRSLKTKADLFAKTPHCDIEMHAMTPLTSLGTVATVATPHLPLLTIT